MDLGRLTVDAICAFVQVFHVRLVAAWFHFCYLLVVVYMPSRRVRSDI